MRIAVDTNVISALWSEEPAASFASGRLQLARQTGNLVVSAPVFAEVLAHPKASERFVEKFMDGAGIRVEFEISEAVWREAGRRFAAYAVRRRRSGGTHPKRLLADFLIGAHALLRTDRLLTFDRNRYAGAFPELKLL